MTVDELLAEISLRAAERPRAEALVETGGRRLSYGALGRAIEAAAAGLARAGLAPGDQVLFSVPPRLEAIVLILAVARAGGVIVAFDPRMGQEVCTARLALLAPRWFMVESWPAAAAAFPPARRLLHRRGLALPDVAALPACQTVVVGWRPPGVPPALTYQRLSRASPGLRAEWPPRGPGDPAFVVFTSGTTTAPRAVLHSGASIGAGMAMVAQQLAFEPCDVLYTDQLHFILPGLMAGIRIVIPRYRRFSPQRLLRDLERFGVTHTFATPAEFGLLLDHGAAAGRRLPAAMRAIVLGSAPVQGGRLRHFRQVAPAGTEVWCVYAMSEMLPVSRIRLDEKPAFDGDGDLVGEPFPGVVVRVAEDGELVLRGPNLCTGYIGGPAMDEHYSGDLARIDAGGRIVLLGRKKDMIIRGHDNIYPSLVEATISEIAGVRRCALVGLPNGASGDELVVLAVEAAPAADALKLLKLLRQELCHGCHAIGATAQPDHIVLMPIPLAGRSAKPDKTALRRLLRARLRC